MLALALAADHPRAQALVLSCTDLATLDALPRIEATIGKPLITSNGATWRAVLTRLRS